VIGLLAQGLCNKELAGNLGLSEGTVKVYLSRLFDKTGVADRFELALLALSNLSSSGEAVTETHGLSRDRLSPIEIPVHFVLRAGATPRASMGYAALPAA
jgi:hypothetical protein